MTLGELTTVILGYAFATAGAVFVATNWMTAKRNQEKEGQQEVPVSQKKEELRRSHPDPEIFRVDVKTEEKNVHAPIDSWMEFRISHPLFSTSFLYALIPVFENLEFVDSAYIATNGLVRLNIKGKKSNMFEDIALHPSDEGMITIIRSDLEGYEDLEDEVLQAVIRHTERVVSLIESKSWADSPF